MAQRSQMYYAYFPFYVAESEIIAGIEDFCTRWEHMFAVGYNYHEFKCYADNLGGFEHWVGDMRGYISQTRETGFMDGSPSDAVFDQGLLMGSERTFVTGVEMLNGYKPTTKFVFRKQSAVDAGVAHKILFTCGTNQMVEHPVMYILDHTQIEIIEQVDTGIVDSSDVDSYSLMVETDKTLSIGTEESLSAGSLTDFNNAFDRSATTYCKWNVPGDSAVHNWIIDMRNFTNIAIDIEILENLGAPQSKGTCSIYYSKDQISWTQLGINFSNSRKQYNAVGLDARYVKIVRTNVTNWPTIIYLYRLMCS